MNKFQIIIPTKNSTKTINKLINSLKIQNYKNWEAIFIDQSTNEIHIRYLKKLCASDKRLVFRKQKKIHNGLYGAMNQGLALVKGECWILFWGSDDWTIDSNTFEMLNNKINTLHKEELDLIVCKGKYFNLKNNFLKNSYFKRIKFPIHVNKTIFRKFLLNGYTPPHQATLFNSNLFHEGFKYDDNYLMAGDLDLFCELSNKKNLSIFLFDLYIVSMSSGGISSKNHIKRFREVIKSYIKLNGKLFLIPFFRRYLLKIFKIS